MSVETIYKGFGSKKALLREAMDVAVVGDAEPIPYVERPEFAALGQGTLAERIARGIAIVAEIHERSAGIWQAIVEAASADPEVDEWRRGMEENRRIDVAGASSSILGEKVDDALVTLLWVLYSPETYRKLVIDDGMSRAGVRSAARRRQPPPRPYLTPALSRSIPSPSQEGLWAKEIHRRSHVAVHRPVGSTVLRIQPGDDAFEACAAPTSPASRGDRGARVARGEEPRRRAHGRVPRGRCARLRGGDATGGDRHNRRGDAIVRAHRHRGRRDHRGGRRLLRRPGDRGGTAVAWPPRAARSSPPRSSRRWSAGTLRWSCTASAISSSRASRSRCPRSRRVGTRRRRGCSPATAPADLSAEALFSFFGRVAEIAALEDAWKRAAAGELQVVLISGEPGMGKTSLAAHVARSAHAGGAHRAARRVRRGLRQPVPVVGHGPHPSRAAPTGRGRRPLLDVHRHVLHRLLPLHSPTPGQRTGHDQQLLLDAVASLLGRRIRTSRCCCCSTTCSGPTRPASSCSVTSCGAVRPPPCSSSGRTAAPSWPRGAPLPSLLADLRRVAGTVRLDLEALPTTSWSRCSKRPPATRCRPRASTWPMRCVARPAETRSSPSSCSATWARSARSSKATTAATSSPRTSPTWPCRRACARWSAIASARVGDDVLAALSTAAVIGQDFDLDLLRDRHRHRGR